MFASYSALEPGPTIVTLARGESLSEPSSSLTLLSTINFPQQASWCPALRGKPRLLQAEPSPLVKVGCAVCTSAPKFPGPGTSPHPAPGSPPLVGAQNMQLLLHPSPHYPITFAPFILARFPESFSFLQTLSNVHLRNFFHSTTKYSYSLFCFIHCILRV